MPQWVIADSSYLPTPHDTMRTNLRGLNVFSSTELRGITGQSKQGEMVTGYIQTPYFCLTPEERISIMKRAAYVQAVIGIRMNRISNLKWAIVHKKEELDRYYDSIKALKQIYDEYDDPQDMKQMVTRFKIKKIVQSKFPDVKDDLSNFRQALYRFKKRTTVNIAKHKADIEKWVRCPNNEDTYVDFTKKWVESFMLHGAVAQYKEWNNSRLENVYVLPGGTVYPLRSQAVGGFTAYTQIILGCIPKIYFKDEIYFKNYLPSAAQSYGYVPLDCLINKTAEQLLFDQFAAERADGTKEPEKLVVMGDTTSPFGDLTGEVNFPLNSAEHKRIEEKLNIARKGAVIMLTGVGTPVVADISKADTFAAQSERQDKLLRDTALVFNMTNMEINLAGGQFTSGKETSESQKEIEEGKGTKPIIGVYQVMWTDNIKYRYGSEWEYKNDDGLTDMEQIKLDALKEQSGTYTKNEIREDRGDDPIIEEGNDTLSRQAPGQPGESPVNPLNMRNV